ncbi:MAG: peptidylprolyl isomerase [Planctomycetota bacterium]
MLPLAALTLPGVLLAYRAPQAPAAPPAPPPAATWKLEDKGGRISLEEFDRFLGRLNRNRPLGQQALTHLLQIQLVEREAEKRGLRVPEEKVEERFQQARQAMEQAGPSYEEQLVLRGISEEEFLKLIRDSLLHEMLVRADRAEPSDAPVTADEARKWTAGRIQDLLELARNAPPGWVLQAPSYAIREQDLGTAIRQALPPARLREDLRQLALERILDQMAQDRGWAVTADLLEEEIEWRRQRVAENPAFAGAGYETLLKAQGSSLEEVRRGGELRTAGILRLLARERMNDAWFAGLSPEKRHELDAQYGAARLAAWILLRAKEQPADPLDLDFSKAAEELEKYAAGIHSKEDFLQTAERDSEDERTRRNGGVLGWIHRKEPGLEPALQKAVFQVEPGLVFGPFQVLEGEGILMVVDTRPQPPEAEFRSLVRRGKHVQLRKTVLVEAGLKTIYDPKG